jgi:BirA family biotin operon repressor/biotin-[acetyl-CoA-carboxylase] ligase
MSVGKQIDMSIAHLAPITLVVGLAVAEALHQSRVCGVSLKWPNDVLINGTKAAGILVEVAGVAAPQLVIGVGLNLGSADSLSSQLGFAVADARRENAELSRNHLVARLIDCLVEFTQRFEASGFEPFRDAWDELHAYRNCLVDVHVGGDVVTGVVLPIGATGELRLRVGDTVRTFNSGEVSLRTHHAV